MKLRIRAKEGVPIGLHGYHSETRDRSIVHTVYTTAEEAEYRFNEDSTVYYFKKGYHNYWIKKEHCDILGEPVIGGELVE